MSTRRINLNRTLDNTSFLNIFPALEDEDRTQFLNVFRSYVVSNDIKNQDMLFQYYQVELNDWLDLISNKFYQTPYLWWVVAIFNDILNPFEDLEEGMILKVLRYDYVYLIFDDIVRISSL